MIGKASVPAYGFAYAQISKDTTTYTGKPESLKEGQQIVKDEQSLTYLGYDEHSSLLNFQYVDSALGVDETVQFSVRYWQSYVLDHYDHPFASGAYCFRPMRGQPEAFPYGKVTESKVSLNGQNQAVEFTFFLEKDAYGAKNQERSVVTVGFSSDPARSGAIRFDVTLDSLPYKALNDGFEVVTQFKVKGMKTDKTFYTDSNGLDMQKRVLDYRPTWDLTYPDPYMKENVTANYYPVNSAIAVEDSKIRMTVLNDRSQGGSSLEDGTVELMQNRKIPADDNKGVGEWLMEKNEFGRGIRVKASYHLVISKAGDTLPQRKTQIAIENPLQYFFSDSAKLDGTGTPLGLDKAFANAGVKDGVRMLMYPKDRNLIQFRFENMHENASAKVDLAGIVIPLWDAINGAAGTGV